MGVLGTNINKTKATDYTLLFLLVGVTGIPFFKVGDITFLVLFLGLAGFVFLYRKLRFDRFFIFLFLFSLRIL